MLPLTTSERKCVIKGCGNISMFKQSHQFPSMPDRCALWLQAIGQHLDDDLVGLPIDKFKRRIVCVDHFEPSCISPQSPRFLKRTAVPSIFPEDGVPVRPHVTPARAPTAAASVAVAATRTIVLPKPRPEDRQKMFLINKSSKPATTQHAGPTLLIEPLENTSTQEEMEKRLLSVEDEAESTEAELPMFYVSSHYGRRGRPKPALKITKVYPNRKAQPEPAPAASPERDAFPEYLAAWEERPDSPAPAFHAPGTHQHMQHVVAVEDDWSIAEAADAMEAENNNVVERKLQEALTQYVQRNLPSEPAHYTPTYVEPSAPCTDSSPFVPRFAEYLLIGGGIASVAALRTIRARRPNAKVLLVTDEYAYPYRRTLLSKCALWRHTELADLDRCTYANLSGEKRSLLLEPESAYTDAAQLWAGARGGAAAARGYTLRRVDAERRTVVLSARGRPDATVRYGKCLLATGASAAPLPPVLDDASPEVRARCARLRSAWDARELWRRADAARALVVVGGGYLGGELAGALADRVRCRGGDTTVTLIFREAGVMWHVLPDYLSRWTMRRLVDLGVRVCPNTEILNAYMKNGRVTLELSNAEILEADVIVVCVGSVANTQYAAASGLEVHPELGGLVVNADYCVESDLYAAGDVACYWSRHGRRRGEHAAHAAASGRACALRMCGAARAPPPRPLPELRGRLAAGLRYEAIGIVDSNLEMTGAFSNLIQLEGCDRNYDQGVVFYLQRREIVGVLMWNLRGRMRVARQVLTEMNHRSGDINELADLFIVSDSSLRKLEADKSQQASEDSEDDGQLYQCAHCPQAFSTKPNIVSHMAECHACCHACDVCPERFGSAAELMGHYAGHAGADGAGVIHDGRECEPFEAGEFESSSGAMEGI